MATRPSTYDLLKFIRKDLKSKKVPKVFADSCGAWEGFGKYQFSAADNDLRVEWQLTGDAPKSALFSELCNSPARNLDRLELGWLIADIIEQDAQRLLQCIPGPNEAMAHASRHWKLEREWRHWAMVQAGHMKF